MALKNKKDGSLVQNVMAKLATKFWFLLTHQKLLTQIMNPIIGINTKSSSVKGAEQ